MFNVNDNTNEQIFNENYINWQKNFVSGDQFTEPSIVDGKSENIYKQYYWQEQRVYNLIKTRVDTWDADYDENWLWGKGKAVDQLIPYQKHYNELMNQIAELTRRAACPVVAVEDGSVDTDEFSEEGLAPGKMLIYRQGGKAPQLLTTSVENIAALYGVALGIKAELIQLMDDLEDNFN